MVKRERVILGVVVLQAVGFFTIYKLHASSGAEAFGAPKAIHVPAAELIGPPVDLLGSQNAPYTLVEFGDYQCPPCARASGLVTALMARHPDQLRFRFRNFPLPMHERAMPCAIAAETARGLGRYWEVHDAFYAMKSHVTMNNVAAALAKLKVDVVHVAASVRRAAKGRVTADMVLATKLQLDATPSFILCCPDGRVLLLGDLKQAEKLL